ncbi:MAG TPA: pilus assembly protein PilP [Candidatus Accumulibacter phosphatis]|nr:MAG: Pilus assembly protein, PilP [Candidatus Accumulibacter sp. SK-11]HAY27496.1 pilus assembly protein PilP [Accumulibacter sp.]HRL74450.1 pilus assembly protein PilP [Candidatus Accumulibacter phosphatis]HCN67571.1 pilus assembly protein PilP [Accumulibacter sp.]HCV13019.1 pilus assembly protein PilP [Accumulibacter sp.]
MMRILPWLLLTSLVAVGCADNDQEELREWMKTAAAGAKPNIPPLPVVQPYEAVPYEVGNLTDPFTAAKMGPADKKSGGGFRPDLERPKEPLELYPLESLKYVGVITRNRASFAIVQVEAALHQVKIGNYMGQNFGVVVGITESEITLRELVQDSAGDWVERTSTLMLQEKGAR